MTSPWRGIESKWYKSTLHCVARNLREKQKYADDLFPSNCRVSHIIPELKKNIEMNKSLDFWLWLCQFWGNEDWDSARGGMASVWPFHISQISYLWLVFPDFIETRFLILAGTIETIHQVWFSNIFFSSYQISYNANLATSSRTLPARQIDIFATFC